MICEILINVGLIGMVMFTVMWCLVSLAIVGAADTQLSDAAKSGLVLMWFGSLFMVVSSITVVTICSTVLKHIESSPTTCARCEQVIENIKIKNIKIKND